MAPYAVKHGGFGKSAPNFLFVWYCDFSSIVHRFRAIELLIWTANDVIAVSVTRWRHRMLKMADSERATRIWYRSVLKIFRYLSSFSSYSTFYFTMDNPYLRRKFWGFSDPNYPKVVNYHLDLPKALPCIRKRVLSHNLHGRSARGDL